MARGWRLAARPAANQIPAAEKLAIGTACEIFIRDVLLPKFLPEIRPSTQFNYPVGIFGKWHGSKYRFLTRYRSDRPTAIAPEFDAPFARLDYVGPDSLDLYWHRHTGEWLCVLRQQRLTDALHVIESDGLFMPC